jgi:hypothetical protein
MRCKHKKNRQKSVVKNLPKLFGARNPRKLLMLTRAAGGLGQSYTCLKPKGHQTLLYLYFRLGKGILHKIFNSFLG